MMRAAAEHLTPCVLELGGKNPVVCIMLWMVVCTTPFGWLWAWVILGMGGFGWC